MRKIAIVVLVALLVVANVFTPWRVEHIRIRLEPEVIFNLGAFAVTNTLITGVLVGILLIAFGRLATRRLQDAPAPHSLQNAIEAIFELLYGYVESFSGERARAFFPLLASFFLYILLSNWLAVLPGVGSIIVTTRVGAEEEVAPLLRSATSDLNATLALAVISVVSSQAFGMRFRGFWAYIGRFIAIKRVLIYFKELFSGQRPSASLLARGLLDMFIGLLEIFEELTKVLSFSFRLFGNIFGGEVLLAVMAFLAPYVASLPFMGIEMLGGLIQAFIFSVLSAAFFTRAATAHDETPVAPVPTEVTSAPNGAPLSV